MEFRIVFGYVFPHEMKIEKLKKLKNLYPIGTSGTVLPVSVGVVDFRTLAHLSVMDFFLTGA